MSQDSTPFNTNPPRTVPFHVDESHDVTELLHRAQHHDFRKVAEWLEERPQIADVVLREANSVNNALLKKIESLEHALAYLGLRGLERLTARLLLNGDQQEFRRRAASAIHHTQSESSIEIDQSHRRIA